MTSSHIIRLGPSNLQAFRDLNAVFAGAFEDPESYLNAAPSDTYAAKILARPEVIALVAKNARVIVGGLVAYELPKLEQARSEIYIYDLAVSAQHRRQGIATLLIQSVLQIAKNRNAHAVFVQADYGDDPAIALYTKLGSREDVLHFDLIPQKDQT